MRNKYLSLNLLFNSPERYSNAYQKIKSNNPKYKDFKIEKNEIVYKETNAIVVPKEDVESVLEDIYKNDTNVLGKGVTTFYKYIVSKYLNITRREVEAFLKKQNQYQISYNPNKIVNKSIIELFPNARYQIDLIDMGQYESSNYGKRYILNCVDIFSRKLWLKALKNKEPKDVLKAFEEILEETKIKPLKVQTDNGNEFKGEFSAYLKEKNIFQIFNDTYTPNMNAIVERKNADVRSVIRQFMIKNQNFKWYNILDKVEDNLNNQFSSSIKNTPNDIWSPTNTKFSGRILTKNIAYDKKTFSQSVIYDDAIQKIKNQKQYEFNVDDVVRVKMSVIFSNIRKAIKSGNSKQIVITYTPILFKIIKVVKGDKIKRTKYLIENLSNNQVLQTKNEKNKYVYSSDMILAEGNENNNSDISMEKALKLNKVDVNSNDLIFE